MGDKLLKISGVLSIVLIMLMAIYPLEITSATTVNYYYHPQCSHCKQIQSFMQKTIYKYNNIEWNILDTSQGSYKINGTPFLELTTNDNRNIELSGSYKIPRFLKCELDEMSTLNCPTYSYLNCTTNSFFIR